MTIKRYVHVLCDGLEDCTWYDDPMQGEVGQTVNEVLRHARWVTKNGKHLCPECRVALAEVDRVDTQPR